MSMDMFEVVSSSLNSSGLISFNKCSRCGSKKSFDNRRHSRTMVCSSASLSSRNLEKNSKHTMKQFNYVLKKSSRE